MGPVVNRRLTLSRVCREDSIYARMTPAVASGRMVIIRPLRSGKVNISFCTTSVSSPMDRLKRSVYSRTGVRSSTKPHCPKIRRANVSIRVNTSESGGNMSAKPLMRVALQAIFSILYATASRAFSV